jgi:NAD(P)-dependent dehydrogenase (short-subunit alcohol dehydrogenase family)
VASSTASDVFAHARPRRGRPHRQHRVDGRRPPIRRGDHITAKAAVIGLSEALRSEVADSGIGVSAFCPGPVQTNIREGGRMRPARYSDSGYTTLELELEERPNSPLWMDPRECGERVLAGIRRDDLYIFTHREFREGADERFRAMLASFPDEPVDDDRADAIRFLLSNPIYARVLERRST